MTARVLDRPSGDSGNSVWLGALRVQRIFGSAVTSLSHTCNDEACASRSRCSGPTKTMTTSARDLQYCTPLKISQQPNTPWDEKYDANEERTTSMTDVSDYNDQDDFVSACIAQRSEGAT